MTDTTDTTRQLPAPATTTSSPTHAPASATATSPEGVSVAPLSAGMASLSAGSLPGETLDALLARILREARTRSLDAVQATIFCDPALARELPEKTAFPAAFLGRHDTPEGDLRGARITALPRGSFTPLADARGNPTGAVWETADARHILLGALTPADTTATPADQSAALWRDLKDTLNAHQFAITDVVRTWFYNDHILDWYDDFNRVRTAFFNENNIFGKLVPASTGIGVANATGAALSLDAYAIAPKKNDSNNGSDGNGSGSGAVAPLRIEVVPSPLQCPANDYNSAFSRAVEISGGGAIAGVAGNGGNGGSIDNGSSGGGSVGDNADNGGSSVGNGGRHLLVSGTASIEMGGLTAHKDDLDSQIKLSLRVVDAILTSRQMTWSDVSRAILYFPKIEWMRRFDPCRAALNLPPFPAIFAHSDICRDDLLFEIELDAFQN